MKMQLILLVLATTVTAEANTELFICEGKIGTQDITFLDDGHKAGILKGKVNVAAGSRGNNFPFVTFSQGDLRYTNGGETCELVVSNASKGSFTVSAPCNGAGPGKITNLSISSLELTADSVDVVCRFEEFGAPQPARNTNDRRDTPRSDRDTPRSGRSDTSIYDEDDCRDIGASHVAGTRRPPGSRYDSDYQNLPFCDEEQ